MGEQDSITEHLMWGEGHGRRPQLRGKAGRTGKKPHAEQTEKARTSGAFGLVKWVDKQSEAQRGQVSVPILRCPVTSQGENPRL